MSQEEESFGSSYKFQHIAEVSENSRLVGTKSYRLKIRRNGNKESDAIVVYFSSKDLRKGKRTQEELLQSFFSFMNSNQSLKETFIGHGRRAEFKRAFLLNGTEVLDLDELSNDAEIWLSLGEDFIPIECRWKPSTFLAFFYKAIFCISLFLDLFNMIFTLIVTGIRIHGL